MDCIKHCGLKYKGHFILILIKKVSIFLSKVVFAVFYDFMGGFSKSRY